MSIIKTGKNIPWSGYMATYAIKNIYNNILKHKSSIIFVNTRAQAEVLFQSLWKINKDKLNIAVHHGSLEKKLRIKIEEKMFRGLLNCIVATSSLELGIDWGNISLIIQVGAPKGISRMIQRIGRSNHKINLPSKAILVPTNKFEYLECEAAKKAIYENDIEEIKIKKGSLDVLAQHIFGVACSKPFNTDLLFKNIKTSFPYKNLDIITFNKVLEFVENGGYSLKHYKEFNKIIIIPAAILSSLPKKIKTFPKNEAAIPKLMKTKENPNAKIIVLIKTIFLSLSISSSFLPVI